MYSLGVIFFEMLYTMDTQMERHEVLKALREGVFPTGFEAKYQIEVFYLSLSLLLFFYFFILLCLVSYVLF